MADFTIAHYITRNGAVEMLLVTPLWARCLHLSFLYLSICTGHVLRLNSVSHVTRDALWFIITTATAVVITIIVTCMSDSESGRRLLWVERFAIIHTTGHQLWTV